MIWCVLGVEIMLLVGSTLYFSLFSRALSLYAHSQCVRGVETYASLERERERERPPERETASEMKRFSGALAQDPTLVESKKIYIHTPLPLSYKRVKLKAAITPAKI